LLYYKPPAKKPNGHLLDRYPAIFPKVRRHKWEQSASTFEPLIKSLSRPGDRVLDPFGGSGAVLEACQHLGRNAEGWDYDSKAIEIMERRFNVRAICD
jgi:DNA modification methylase